VKILVVDDERLLVKGLTFNLEHEGYDVVQAYDGEEAVAKAAGEPFDLILMDLMMPKINGLEACRRIREFSGTPIIMLTAKGEDVDKLLGFDHGADDYITKPFNILELKARIRAILRRSVVQNRNAQRAFLSSGDLALEPDTRRVVMAEKPVELTVKEFDLAEVLMRNPGRVYSRELLLDTVWGFDFPGDTRTVDVNIRRLREKIEPDPANPEYFLTKRGVGYYFRG